MLPDDDFLRQLPLALEKPARFRIEAMVHAADMAQVSLERLRHGLELLDISKPVSPPMRAALFSDAWTIVDQVHVLRQFIAPKADAPIGPKTAALLAHADIATQLRNKMDHLHHNIRNRAQKTGPQNPLFGSINCFRGDPTHIHEVGGKVRMPGQWLIIMAGSASGDLISDVPVEEELRLPVGNIRLSAFELCLRLDTAVDQIADWIASTSATMEAQIRAAVADTVAREGGDVTELMQPCGNNFVLVLEGYREAQAIIRTGD